MALLFHHSSGGLYILSTLPDGHRSWKSTGATSRRDALKALREFEFSPATTKPVRKIPTLSEFGRQSVPEAFSLRQVASA